MNIEESLKAKLADYVVQLTQMAVNTQLPNILTFPTQTCKPTFLFVVVTKLREKYEKLHHFEKWSRIRNTLLVFDHFTKRQEMTGISTFFLKNSFKNRCKHLKKWKNTLKIQTYQFLKTVITKSILTNISTYTTFSVLQSNHLIIVKYTIHNSLVFMFHCG